MKIIPAFISLFIFSFYLNVFCQPVLKKMEDLTLSPISAFKNYCTRCHGEEGSAYGKGFADLKDDSLRNVVEEMMFGPGGLNPNGTDVDAMVSYNKSLKNKSPFAVVLNLKSFLEGKEKSLKIETVPGAKLEIVDAEIKLEKSYNIWHLYFNPQKKKRINVLVSKNGVTSMIRFPEEIWTH